MPVHRLRLAQVASIALGPGSTWVMRLGPAHEPQALIHTVL